MIIKKNYILYLPFFFEVMKKKNSNNLELGKNYNFFLHIYWPNTDCYLQRD